MQSTGYLVMHDNPLRTTGRLTHNNAKTPVTATTSITNCSIAQSATVIRYVHRTDMHLEIHNQAQTPTRIGCLYFAESLPVVALSKQLYS